MPIVLSLALGLVLSFYLWQNPTMTEFSVSTSSLDTTSLNEALNSLDEDLQGLRSDMESVSGYLESQAKLYEDQREQLQSLAKNAQDYTESSDGIYEFKIISLLGDPVGFASTKSSTIMVFDFYKIDYRGFVAKVTPKKEEAIDVVLAESDQRETTSAALERVGGMLAINGGGFYSAVSGGKTVYIPLGNTVMDYELQHKFIPTYKDITFVGFTKDAKLVGGEFETEEELLAKKPYAGVTFVPQLLSNGQKTEIPPQWAKAKQPRTIVGEYPNKDILLIVIDGRQSDWSSGVTLEEAQDVLIQLGIKEAYNLDGGGSTSMVFNGEILNKPSDGVERPVVSNIIVY
jgi:hypothetical protein